MDSEIANLGKDAWKRSVKTKVRAQALSDLNSEAAEQKNGANLIPYNDLSAQEYIKILTPKQARKIFHIRTGTIDIRGVRKYTYGDDTSCRLCEDAVESVEHIVNHCCKIDRLSQIKDLFTNNIEELREISHRCILFDKKVEETKKDTENGGVEILQS